MPALHWKNKMTILPASDWKPNQEGIYADLPAETYHAAPGFSHSMAKNMDPPARLPVYLDEKREKSTAMIMGTLTHSAVLEPDKTPPQVVIEPESYPAPATHEKVKKGVIKAGDAIDWHNGASYCKDWHRQQGSRIALKQSEWETVHGMVGSIARHPTCQLVFRNGSSELSCFRRHEATGVLLKFRLDWTPPEISDSLVDIKTCQNEKADSEEFSKVLFDMRYYTQGAWYVDNWNLLTGESRKHFTFIAVEKKRPYLIALHYMEVGDNTWLHAAKLNEYNIQTYARCVNSNSWPGYDPQPRKITIPEWASKKESGKEVARWMETVGGKV